MTLPRMLFFLVFFTLWGLMHVWVGRRLIAQGSEYSPRTRRSIWVAVAALGILPLLGFFGRRLGLVGGLLDSLQWLGFICMGLSSLLISFTMVVDLSRLLLAAGRKLADRRRGESKDTAMDPARRRFFADVANYGIVGGAAGLSAVGFGLARRVPAVVEIEVPIADLHPDLVGFRIAQLSDVHIGPTIHGAWLEKVVAATNAAGPDLVALTGDFVDGHVAELGPELEALSRLEARHGAFFVTGNHEYYWDGPAWCRFVASLGPTVLCNEHRLIEHGEARLLVAGVTDLHADRNEPSHRSDPAAAKAGAPAHDVSLLLAHQPRSVFAAAEVGFDLQLSGHTHAGQYFPMSLLIHLMQPYVSGLNRHGDMQIYVSRGTGYWGPPNRAGSPSEITLLT
ncbi:MAG: metallophosphoesterase, partial [Myxococcales bacterium]|nr:metallophosphoesterase [Myxococcales bacterium]